MRTLAIASVSFSAAVFCSAFLPGTAAAGAFAVAFSLFGILCFFLPSLSRRKQLCLAAFAAAFGLLWSALYSTQTVEKAKALDGQTLPVAIVLSDYPQTGSSFVSARGILATEGLPSLGIKIYDTTYTLSSAVPGQYVTLTARLKSADTRYGEPYEAYLASGIYLIGSGKGAVTLGETVFSLRYLPVYAKHFILSVADRVFSPDIRPFMKSLLLGDKTEFYQDPSLEVSMSRSGIMHIVAVSGMHISFLVGFLWLLFGHSAVSSLLSLVLVWFFVLITGAPSSAVRAGVMQSFLLLAPILRRENDPPTSLSAALAVLLFANPYSVRSAGLQLSFCAAAGIQLFAGRILSFLQRCFGRFSSSRPVRSLTGILASSLSVMILSVPATAIRFGSVQVLSPVTNILVMWAVSLCFSGGIASLLLGAIFLPAGKLLALPVRILVRYIILASRAVSAIPFASLYTCSDFSVYWVAGTYILFLLFLFLPVSTRKKFFYPFTLSVVSLALLLTGTKIRYDRYAGVFSVINVGQGESVAVFSGDKTLMIDCGSIMTADSAGDVAGSYLLSCGRRSVDLLVLTHLHDDHVNGIPVLLEYLQVKEIAISAYAPDEEEMLSTILQSAEAHNVKISYIGREAEALLGDISIRMLTPLSEGDANDQCVISIISIGDYDMLVTGDASKASEEKLLQNQSLPAIDLYVAGHHGSKTSTGTDLLETLRQADNPVAVISCGYNTFGHPSSETLEALEKYSILTYRTDLDGTVQFTLP